MLDASVMRQEAIASNIANVDTPGYRRIDLAPDFAAELRARLAAGEAPASMGAPRLAEDPSARTLNPDGNTVELDHELLQMNRNMMEHDFLTELVTSSIKQLRLAITGRAL